MIVHILRGEGLDPGWLIGSPIGEGLANSHWSEGEWLVIEADESDRSMLSLHVEVAVLTNVELDHHASFRSLAELREAFAEFLARASGAIVLWDRPELLALAPAESSQVTATPATAAPRLVAYRDVGLLEAANGARFLWREHEVALGVPGAHNALNATAALEAALLAGAEEQRAPARLAAFSGAGRRFQRVGVTAAGATVIDDYAHHPTEVAATLQAARTLLPRRLVAIFQPHLYSRTAMLAREFGAALAHADAVAVLDVYPARERAEDFPGVSGLTIARAVSERAHGREVLWLPDFAHAHGVLAGLLHEGDLCIAMGAGDIDVLARELVA